MDHPKTGPFLKDDFAAMRAASNKSKLQELIEQSQKYLHLLQNTTLDIGITGVSGQGKSSLVNAIRGLGDEDDNSAKTDVKQGTLEPTSYPHPLWPNVTIWDLPGIGTKQFQAAQYLKLVHFDKYDFFIIVSATRFAENDAKLAQEIEKKKKKFYFVRTKIDIDLQNEGKKKNFKEEKTLDRVKSDCYHNLQQPRVFLFSRWDLDKYDFPSLVMTLEEDILMKKDTFDIAITGMVGSGKSSLVNALRGLDDDDDDNNAARTGVVQRTLHPERYPHPSWPKVTIWDLPGVGTAKYQPVNFDKYDCVIVVSSTRFTENDAKLVQEIQKRKKKLYFVRSKIDIDLGNECRKKDFKEEKIVQHIKNNCYQHLKAPRVFLVSRWHLEKYDFPHLVMTLEEELDDLKRQVLILAMPAFSKEVLEKKKEAMEKVIWMQALVSCGLGAIPVPGLSFACDVAILVGTLTLFCNVFGLDDASIANLSKRVGKDEAVLRSAITKSPMASQITTEFVVGLLDKSLIAGSLMAIEFVLDFVPIVGSITGGGLSFITTFYMLKDFLNDVVGDAQNVLAVCED